MVPMGWLHWPKPRRWWWRGWWQSRHIGHRREKEFAVAHRFGAIPMHFTGRPGDRHSDAIPLDVVVGRVPAHAHHNAFNLRFSRYLARTTAFALRHNAHGGSPNRVCAAYAAVVPHSGRTF